MVVLARLFRAALDHLGVVGYPKVSGKRGVQIFVPVTRGYTFDDTREWVEALSRAVGDSVPELVSWKWHKHERRGLARLDYTQNAINKTLVAPYSVRPVAGAPVSAPIEWDELDDPDLRPDGWTIRSIVERIDRIGDPFATALGHEQRLPLLAELRPRRSDESDRPRTKAHVAYEVDDVDHWRTKLAQHGMKILDSVPIEGFARFEARDPFGNRVEFLEGPVPAEVPMLVTERLRLGDAVPRTGAGHQIRPNLLDGVPPRRRRRLEDARSPSGNSQMPARAHHAPQFAFMVNFASRPRSADEILSVRSPLIRR